MSNWELMHTETRDGFEIRLHITPETDDPEGCFASGDDAADAELCARIRSGDLMWFIARVTVSKAGVELGDDYLGACCYDNIDEFVAGDYYPDMVEAARERAHDTLAALAA
jgi:hypothetical protein